MPLVRMMYIHMLCQHHPSINVMMFHLPEENPALGVLHPTPLSLARPDQLCLPLPPLDDFYRWTVTIGTFLSCSYMFKKEYLRWVRDQK